MRLRDFDLLDEIGLSSFEKLALVTLMRLGVADAATLCREGAIPTSKIYQSMEKLGRLGLAGIQRTRPKIYAARPAEAVVSEVGRIVRERADAALARSAALADALSALPEERGGRETFVDLALGSESHARRHLSRLAEAKTRIISYLEQRDLDVLERAAANGLDVLKRIGRATATIEHRVIFGFTDRSAPRLLEFLRKRHGSVRHLAGIRYSGEIGRPFHVMDDEIVILSLDHPFAAETRFASLLVRDRALAASLSEGFENLWREAMRDLREVRMRPRL
jgi:sugar-specific transcriptional regulator TrmB